jgi:hypothetical protein
MFYIALLPVLVLSVITIVRLARLEKHDRVLFRFCEVRRQLMSLLRETGTDLSRDDYAAARTLLDMLESTIQNYHQTKQVLLNGRRFLRFLDAYSTTAGAVERLPAIHDARLREVRVRFARAVFLGYLEYTLLLRSELLARWSLVSMTVFAHLGLRRMKNLAAALITARIVAQRQGRELGYAY